MDERKQQLLQLLVEEYIATAEPVSSGQLVDKYKLPISSATVRNCLLQLEREGFIASPHTSSGRVPTARGYRQYVNDRNHADASPYAGDALARSEKRDLQQAFDGALDTRARVKQLAKTLAHISEAAVIAGFSRNDTYYTGLSYLFSHPEFKDHALVYSITEVIDQLDERLHIVYTDYSDELTVQIGRENPFSSNCSFVGFRSRDRLFGLLGPMRMPYAKNIERMSFIRQLLHGSWSSGVA